MRHAPIDPRLFVQNRGRLSQLLPPGSLVVVNAHDVPQTNSDGSLRGVANSDLFYLTGVEQEESILVLFPDAEDPAHREMLFLRQTSDLIAVWEGHKLTQAEARGVTGIRSVHWLPEFPRLFHRLMCEARSVWLDSNEHKRAEVVVETREARFVRWVQERYPLHAYQRLAPLMHRLRVVKSAAEVALIRTACDITGAGFDRLLGFIQPGVNECEIEAELIHEFTRRRGAFAYNPIIASGANACVLHYVENDKVCRDGDLLLLDVAASYANYNSDLTRTVPVNGRFTRRQRQVYDAVLRVLRALIADLRPGRLWKDWQRLAEDAVERECVHLGLLTLRDIRAQDPEKPAVKRYFMHGVGHPIGLDVHDVGSLSMPFESGWVMTVEPGIYIPEEGLAVRLENDVLVTAEGPVDLMAGIPIEAEEIEGRMRTPQGRDSGAVRRRRFVRDGA